MWSLKDSRSIFSNFRTNFLLSVRADVTDTERELTAAARTTLPEILHELLKHISQKKTHLYQNF